MSQLYAWHVAKNNKKKMTMENLYEDQERGGVTLTWIANGSNFAKAFLCVISVYGITWKPASVFAQPMSFVQQT